MIMTIKILYYVDTDDNTKGSLMAFPSDKDLRNLEAIDQISKVLLEANFGDRTSVCNSVACELVYHGDAELTCQMGNYAFGWEETELFI